MAVYDLEAILRLNTKPYEDSLKQAGSDAKSFDGGGGLTKVAKIGGAALAATGAALVGFGKKSIDTGKEFDSSMSQIAATLGYTTDDIKNDVNGAGKNFDALRKKAQTMGAETNFSAAQAADGLNILAMSGYDAESSMAMIEDVLHLAAAGSMDMASAAQYVSGSMKGFADDTKSSGYYANLMAKGATLANTSVSQLGEAMSGGAATAAAYNQNAESMTLSLLRLAEQGEVGSAAGTALAAAMKDLYTPTDQAKTALSDLGVAVYDEKGRARDFNDVVNDLSEAMAGMSDEEANAYKQSIFGIQGLRAYNKMTVTSTAKQKDWAKALKGASDGAGEAAKQYETMTDNLQGDIDIWNSAVDGFKIAMSDKFMPSVREFVKLGADAVGGFTKAFTEGGLPALATEVGKTLAKLIKKVGQKLPEFVKAGTNLITSFLNGVIEALPTLAESATDIVVSLADAIGENLPTLIPKAVDAILTIAQGLVDNADKLISAAATAFTGIAQGLMNAIPLIIEKLPTILSGLASAIADNLGTLLTTVMPTILAVKAGKGLFEGLSGAAEGFSGVMSKLASPTGAIVVATGALVALGTAIINGPKKAYQEAYDEAVKLEPEQQALIDRIKDEADKWGAVKTARQELGEDAETQINDYKALWEQLDKIVDKNGKVKEGYEEQAELITGQLSEALGIELEYIDGQIKGYDDIRDSIDKMLQVKKGQILLAAHEKDYEEAVKGVKNAEKDRADAAYEVSQQEKIVEEATAKVQAAQEKYTKAMNDARNGTHEHGESLASLELELAAAQGELAAAEDKLGKFKTAQEQAEKTVRNYETEISNYNDLMEATAKGGVADIDKAIFNLNNTMLTAKTGTVKTLKEQTLAYAKELQEQYQKFNTTGDDIYKDQVDNMSETVEKSLSELRKLDPQAAAELGKVVRDMKSYYNDFKNTGSYLGEGVGAGLKSKGGGLADIARNVIRNALAAAKSQAGVSSPSKVWRDELGVYLAEGAAIGIKLGQKDVDAAAKNLISSATKEARKLAVIDATPKVKKAAKEAAQNMFPDMGGWDQAYENKLKKEREQAKKAERLKRATKTDVLPTPTDDYYKLSDYMYGSITINVYGTRGQSVDELAEAVAYKLQRLYKKERVKYA